MNKQVKRSLQKSNFPNDMDKTFNIDIPVDSVTKKREWIDRDYRTKCNQIIGNLCNSTTK